MLARMEWTVVVPVKRLELAKSRLCASLGRSPAEVDASRRSDGRPADRPNARLALAMATDTVRAALASSAVARVLVVTDDPTADRVLSALGAQTIPDTPDGGLNAALQHGARTASAEHPEHGVVALSADLGALRPEELTAALRSAASHRRGFVADAQGSGTTLLAVTPGESLQPRFGPDSAAAHLAGGAHRLEGTWPGLRRDLDTAEDLRIAAGLGLGPATAEQVRLIVPDLLRAAG